MIRLFLSSYTMRIYSTSKRKPYTLSSFGNSQDLLFFLEDFLSDPNRNYLHNQKEQTIIKVTNVHRDKRIVRGLVERGEYGQSSNLYDVNAQRLSYKRQPQEADLLPFYFLFAIPQNHEQGVLLLQRIARQGIAEDFTHFVSQEFRDAFQNTFRLNIAKLLPEEIVTDIFERGKITKVRLKRLQVKGDLADQLHGVIQDEPYTAQLTLSSPRGGFRRLREKLLQQITNKQKSLVELSEEYEQFKFELRIDGTRRTVDLTDVSKITPDFDITNLVGEVANGQDAFERIDAVAREFLSTYLTRLGVSSDEQAEYF